MQEDNAFATLGLGHQLLRAVAEEGYTTPTPIQTQAIPLVLQGGDLLAAAQTGTGKTAGFTLPILQRLSERRIEARPGRPRCLILVPTRELAAQVQDSVRIYGRHLPINSLVIFGGVGITPQIEALRKRVDILVATPGRLLDHAAQRAVDLSAIEILVLDEADRMLDMGFIRDIRKVLALLPKHRQNLLFSATFSDAIRELAAGLLHKPGYVEVARRNTASELVEQSVHLVPQRHKRFLLTHLIAQHRWPQVLVFTRTKHGANRLAEQLGKDGIDAAAIHGNKSQTARTRALADFKSGAVQVLVATDIAARGLDIDQLPIVVNFELPNVPEDYVHRIGRTGRAGASGMAVSLVAPEEMGNLADIERLLRRKIEWAAAPDFTPPATVSPPEPERGPRAPAPRRSGGVEKAHRTNRQGKAAITRSGTDQPRRHSRDTGAWHASEPQGATSGNRAPSPQRRQPSGNTGRATTRSFSPRRGRSPTSDRWRQRPRGNDAGIT